MRAINVLLSLVVSVLIFLLVFEGGLRLIGKGPTQTLNRFDPQLGWSKEPNKTIAKHGKGWEAEFAINEHGLREKPGVGPAKSAAFRVVALGDSFTLGYTVDYDDVFANLLEGKWREEGRDVDVVNTGTEAYATDQEVAWLLAHGREYAPNLVLLFPYENDLFWCGEPAYLRFPKPRFTNEGALESDTSAHPLADPGPKPFRERTAIGTLVGKWFRLGIPPPMMSVPGRMIPKEYASLLTTPPEFEVAAEKRARGALIALREECKKLGAELCVAPIPSFSSIDAAFRERYGRDALGLAPGDWSPDRPVDWYLSTCGELGIRTIDARNALRAANTPDNATHLSVFEHENEFHFTARGNHAFAAAVAAQLEALDVLPKATGAPVAIAAEHEVAGGMKKWPFVMAGLWLVLSLVYGATYPKAPKVQGFLVVGVMLSLVIAIFIGVRKLLELVPPQYGPLLAVALILIVLGFVVYKLGARMLTVGELLKAFIGRGHWYLMPLVVVLLTIGSLLVVAASSPFVAPFIYTLF